MADRSLTPVSRDSLVQEIALGLRFDTAGQLDAPWETLVSCVARVSRLTCIKDTRSGLWATREEVGYYPCQARHGAKVLGCAIRAHWGIENQAHYVRDVTLGEDARDHEEVCGARDGVGPPAVSCPGAPTCEAARTSR